jgi:hypothetical protein
MKPQPLQSPGARAHETPGVDAADLLAGLDRQIHELAELQSRLERMQSEHERLAAALARWQAMPAAEEDRWAGEDAVWDWADVDEEAEAGSRHEVRFFRGLVLAALVASGLWALVALLVYRLVGA